MSMTEILRQKLARAFDPSLLEVRDDSEAHRGHSGHREGGESHFQVKIRAAAFGPMSRVERHRAVHAALGPEVIGRIHALALDIGA